jgi:hypothetical protein
MLKEADPLQTEFYISAASGRIGFMLSKYKHHQVDGDMVRIYFADGTRTQTQFKSGTEAAKAAESLSHELSWAVASREQALAHKARMDHEAKIKRKDTEEGGAW